MDFSLSISVHQTTGSRESHKTSALFYSCSSFKATRGDNPQAGPNGLDSPRPVSRLPKIQRVSLQLCLAQALPPCHRFMLPFSRSALNIITKGILPAKSSWRQHSCLPERFRNELLAPLLGSKGSGPSATLGAPIHPCTVQISWTLGVCPL